MSIGFTHHSTILTKDKDIEERKYYIQLSADLNLSNDELKRKIAEDTFHNQGRLPNNFVQTMDSGEKPCVYENFPLVLMSNKILVIR